jgi:hypothetical protein
MSRVLQNPLASIDQLTCTPSRRDHIPEQLEDDLRNFGAELIQCAGILLKLYGNQHNTTQHNTTFLFTFSFFFFTIDLKWQWRQLKSYFSDSFLCLASRNLVSW